MKGKVQLKNETDQELWENIAFINAEYSNIKNQDTAIWDLSHGPSLFVLPVKREETQCGILSGH
jgi:hypothetical protein